MDKYIKWVIFLIILLAISVFLIVHFGVYYRFGDAGLSPSENNINNTNVSKGLIIDDRGSKDFEIPSNSSPAENNTNKSGYWIQDLPDLGGASTITPLIIYDELTRTKNILATAVIIIGVVVYIAFKIRRKVLKKELTSRFTENL